MELIDNWLKGAQNYIVGRNLYNLYGSDPMLKKLFKTPETPTLKQRMREALAEINKQGKRPSATSPIDSLVKNSPVHPATGKPDPVLEALSVKAKAKYQRMKTLQGELRSFGTSNREEIVGKCEVICKEILSLEQELIADYALADNYKTTGALPDVKPAVFVIPSNPVILAKKINSLKRYIRRYKEKLKKEPGNATYAALLQQYETQLKTINDEQKN